MFNQQATRCDYVGLGMAIVLNERMRLKVSQLLGSVGLQRKTLSLGPKGSPF